MSLIILHLTSLLQRRGWETGMIFVKVASDSHIFFYIYKISDSHSKMLLYFIANLPHEDKRVQGFAVSVT